MQQRLRILEKNRGSGPCCDTGDCSLVVCLCVWRDFGAAGRGHWQRAAHHDRIARCEHAKDVGLACRRRGDDGDRGFTEGEWSGEGEVDALTRRKHVSVVSVIGLLAPVYKGHLTRRARLC